ncbi:cold-shock protein [Saccharicrinis aurantiacus]|uniref:cold-shock protein n=1 Tax=Saccharicrinis aurantiacus TaxID=1849719 RepID=UPI00083988BB|nr:cold shock domain-containing protein [Saccharicrinis aurantiacus]
MSKSQETFNKKEREKKRLKKKQDKLKRKEERKENATKGATLDDMIAYVDENGNLTDTPPDPAAKTKIDASTIEISIPKGGKEVMPSVRNGKVDFYNDAKGFGFIRESGTQEKYFFHVNGLIDEVRENDKVTFELEQGLKGLNAVQVTKMK